MNKTDTKTKILYEGTVVSLSSAKTVIVAVVHQFRHPLYKKAVNRTQKFAVHNENTLLAVGDKVKIAETRPMSRTKHYKVVSKMA